MAQLPTNPLAAALKAAARLPATTGTARHYRERAAGSGAAVLLLLDCSASMADMAGARSKLALLQEALDWLVPQLPADAGMIAFAASPQLLAPGARLPDPAGGTALHLALDEAARHRPGRSIVVSDGQPDDAALAFEAAARLRGRIDTLYCGPDNDEAAKNFLRRLARAGAGRCVTIDIVRVAQAGQQEALRAPLRQLALPAR